MAISRWTRRALAALPLFSLNCVVAQDSDAKQWPLHDDGLNDVVQWDHYSFIVNDKRVFLFGGEMHYWRLPVPELWEDVLQKIKAAGMTHFSFYAHWGYHAPTPDTLDFEHGAHNFTRLYELAEEIGLWVIVRPGPYINAETNAGGFPLWLTTGEYGTLRNNDTRYTAAWKPYMDGVSQITAPHQITQDGSALVFQIENEYGYQWTNANTKAPNNTGIRYMELLEANARNNNVNIPLIHNNPNMNSKSWSKDYDTVHAGGDVDVYGIDSYPSCWSCNLAECGGAFVPYQIQYYYEHFQSVSPTQPSFMPEFQGGSYNPWGGPEGGCLNNSNEDFANLYYRHNIGEKVTALNLYMIYGGTSWGWLAAPVVATSYDYSSPISEDRSVGSKYYETKNLALFTRVAEDLRMVDRIGNSTAYSNNPAIFTSELRNPDNNAAFYVTRHTNTSSSTKEAFKLQVSTSGGNFTIPQKAGVIVLNGYQSKIIVTDFHFEGYTLLYSTAEVLSYASFDDKTTLALWVPTGESGEFYVKDATKGSVTRKGFGVDFYPDDNGVLVTFQQASGTSIVEIDDALRVLLLDRTAAYPFFVPALSNDPVPDVSDTVFVQGPNLVRSAKVESNTITLTGDSSHEQPIEVYAPSVVSIISWNGKKLATTKTSYGSLTASLAGPDSFVGPGFGPWKVADSLPERYLNYSDRGAAWVVANHTTTPSVYKNATKPYLYVDEYGFHTGIHLFRGHFNGRAAGAYIKVQGGTAFGWSAFLNGQFVGSFLGSVAEEAGNMTLSFGNATVNAGGNVLLVIQDNSGHDETTGALDPRGIVNATLLGNPTGFSTWKIAGTAGGATNTILDPVRGDYNEGGLIAERLGWHLPGFDDSKWAVGSPVDGFAGAGVKFYRTTFNLSTPLGQDVSMGFRLSEACVVTSRSGCTPSGTQEFRSLLFVNGYQYGRFNPYIGHQTNFPVPPGILNNNGVNTIGLAVWAQSNEGAKVGVNLFLEYVTESGFDFKFNSDYLRPGWTKERLQYA